LSPTEFLRGVDFRHGHFRRVFTGGAHGRNVAGQFGDEADFDLRGVVLAAAAGKKRTDNQKNHPNDCFFHGSSPVFLSNFVHSL
jgi:hypothetical protein